MLMTKAFVLDTALECIRLGENVADHKNSKSVVTKQHAQFFTSLSPYVLNLPPPLKKRNPTGFLDILNAKINVFVTLIFATSQFFRHNMFLVSLL